MMKHNFRSTILFIVFVLRIRRIRKIYDHDFVSASNSTMKQIFSSIVLSANLIKIHIEKLCFSSAVFLNIKILCSDMIIFHQRKLFFLFFERMNVYHLSHSRRLLQIAFE
jgi:hypothetical protein